MMIKKCESCGLEMEVHDKRQNLCVDCRAERNREAARRTSEQRRAKKRVGPSSICKDCGVEFVRNSGAQKYCQTCRNRRAESTPVKTKKKKPLSLAEYNKIAREHGLTYGQAVARGLA